MQVDFELLKKQILERLVLELPSYLTYHDVDHTKYVLKMAEYLAQRQGIEGDDLLLLKIAALYHDLGFTVARANHEEIGCNFAREELPQWGISNDEIEKICGIIMATKIPQKPKTILEKIMADADLEYLSTENFHRISQKLYEEFKHFRPEISQREFDEIQIAFLENHQYYTPFCIKNKENFKLQHLRKLKEKLAN